MAADEISAAELERRRKVFRGAINANVEWLKPRVVTLADTKGEVSTAADLQHWRIGAGTLVSIGRHYLIATAGHVIPRKPAGRMWVITHRMTTREQSSPVFLSSSRHPSEEIDVGYLEVQPDAIGQSFPGNEWISLDNVAIRGVGRPQASVLLVGPPAEHVRSDSENPRMVTLVPNCMSYWTVPLQPEEWAGRSTPKHGRPFDTNVDVLLDYPETDSVSVDGGPRQPLPDPKGMSGGGVWDQQLVTGELWDPSKPKLIGIQSEWWSKGRYLRAVQIIHWLQLIYARFPDLREEMLDAFGEQVRFNG